MLATILHEHKYLVLSTYAADSSLSPSPALSLRAVSLLGSMIRKTSLSCLPTNSSHPFAVKTSSEHPPGTRPPPSLPPELQFMIINSASEGTTDPASHQVSKQVISWPNYKRALDLSLICRQWRGHVCETPSLWAHIDFTSNKPPPLELQLRKSRLRSLQVSVSLDKKAKTWKHIDCLRQLWAEVLVRKRKVVDIAIFGFQPPATSPKHMSFALVRRKIGTTLAVPDALAGLERLYMSGFFFDTAIYYKDLIELLGQTPKLRELVLHKVEFMQLQLGKACLDCVDLENWTELCLEEMGDEYSYEDVFNVLRAVSEVPQTREWRETQRLRPLTKTVATQRTWVRDKTQQTQGETPQSGPAKKARVLLQPDGSFTRFTDARPPLQPYAPFNEILVELGDDTSRGRYHTQVVE